MRRRSLLRGGALVGAGAVGGGLLGGFAGRATAANATNSSQLRESFYGKHQSGIISNTQKQTVLAAFDVSSASRSDLAALMQAWSALAAPLTSGVSHTVPIYHSSTDTGAAYADATNASTTDDSLEAYQLGPSRLTLTVGFGRSLFVDTNGKDRFGLASQLPDQLAALPHFSGEQLTATDSDGDLFLQACADDAQVAFHAVRSIARIAPDVATLRWTQLGYTPDNTGGTPRNLMGFKDGTIDSNLHPPTDLNSTVWAGSEGPAWMQGGSYLVYRRIRMTLEHWDRLAPSDQEQVIGRHKLTGAPLGEDNEFAPLTMSSAIPVDAHVRLAAPQTNAGAVILRRAFSYNNGTTQFTERWPPWRQALEYDAGLLFLAYQQDPRKAFVPINTRLSQQDAMNQFTTHTASAVFAVPPGVTGPGDWFGRSLLS